MMKKIALEMNFSEIAFILSDDEHTGRFKVRILKLIKRDITIHIEVGGKIYLIAKGEFI